MPKFLVIRRDNIGDLVCTTPLLAALRGRFPQSHVAALVNTYNEAVLAGNSDVDAVYAYEKGKHRGERRSLISVYADRVRLILKLRAQKFDYAILAAPGFQPRSLRFARLAGARHIIGFTEGKRRQETSIDMPVPYGESAARHEVEDVLRLLAPLGMAGAPPAAKVVPDAHLASVMRSNLAARLPEGGPLIAIHISARKPSQRWPAERFAELMRALHTKYAARFVLLWSPGSEHNPLHPGDDEKARALAAMTQDLPVLSVPTLVLAELIAALSVCDQVVCSDGGAMHLAAALAKPILCFFGDSPASRWRPWGVRYELLQPQSRDIKDLGVDEALAGFERLQGTRSPPV